MIKVLTLDPGESTGWCFRDMYGILQGGTLPKDHRKVAQLILELAPDVVVLESFHLYPGKAKSLSWNSFYPCEVIGVIKYICDTNGIIWIDQAPSVKKFFGGFKSDWVILQPQLDRLTEHVKDAYMHLKYFERNNERKLLNKYNIKEG